MTSYSVLKIVGTDATIDFMGDNFHLVEWAPAVARRRQTYAGGYSAYEDVTERIRFNVEASSESELRRLLIDIMLVLDQADGWSVGDDVAPVVIQTKINGSGEEEPLQALVLGRGGQSDRLLNLPVNFNDRLMLYEVEGAEIAFSRTGLWLGAERSADSEPDTMPSIMTVDMGEATYSLSPTRVAFNGFDASTQLIGDGFLLLTGAPVYSTFGRNFGLYGFTSMESDEFDAVSDAAHLAYAGSVMRIDAATDQNGTISISNVDAAVSKLQIFVAVRNNSATTAWEVRALSTGYVTNQTGWTTIGNDHQNPVIRHVGTLANQTGVHTNIVLEFRTAAGSGTLDVNYVVVFPLDPNARHLILEGDDYSDAAFARNLVVDPRPLTHNAPVVYIETA